MIQTITDAVQAVGFTLFVVLLLLAVARMTWRLALYFVLKRRPSIILQRDYALLGAFLWVFGLTAVLRLFGVQFEQGSIERLLFIIQSYIVALSAIGFWVKVEYFDVDDPRNP